MTSNTESMATSNGAATPATPSSERPFTEIKTRSYQEELLEESRRRNIVIALDTGSGKTHIALLRIKDEIDRGSKKICWFLAPTVTLIEQQCKVIAAAMPGIVGSITGLSEPDQWKDASLWVNILKTYKIMVSTPQILLNALQHGYINLGLNIGLVVFDEAHHAILKHPYNMIMQSFYHPIPPHKASRTNNEGYTRPAILGLTASPVYGRQILKSFEELERNLDSIIRSSTRNRDELAQFVHRPIFKHVPYPLLKDPPLSQNLLSLQHVIASLNIEDDPYVISLRKQLTRPLTDAQRHRVDQKLSKAIRRSDTFTHKGLQDLERAAADIWQDLGCWAADWFVATVIERAIAASTVHSGIMGPWQDRERAYLLKNLERIKPIPYSEDPAEIMAGLSPKVRILLDCLQEEERNYRTQEEPFSGIIFVKRRDVVIALGEILSRLPAMRQHFQVGCLLGASSSTQRHAFLDITRTLLKQTASETLRDFSIGDKNIVVSTSVAEEGIDIQACGCVIRFDPPDNMVAWAQSRGRARRRRSTFILMLDPDSIADNKIAQWEQTEQEMITQYTDTGRAREEQNDQKTDEDDLQYMVEETGALLTLDSAISHLYHFCAILPHSGHASQLPLFDLDPPDYPEGWHSLDPKPLTQPYTGPWGATCTLPRQVPPHLRRRFVSCVYGSKRSAINHAAFFAYLELYKEGLLNDHLLPLSSVIQPDEDGEVKVLLQEVEKRAGMANVPIQMDPWMIPQDVPVSWRLNLVTIEGLPALYMFTPTELPTLTGDELPTLYVPGRGAVAVSLSPSSVVVDDESVIAAARVYTRRTFGLLHRARMEPGKTDFCYLFLPTVKDEQEETWETRRQWMQERAARSETLRLENEGQANAALLCQKFGYTLDLALIRSNGKFDKPLCFVGYHEGPISDEEAAELKERYDGHPDFTVTYPLIVARPFPRRANFLAPLEDESDGLGDVYDFLLHPRYTTVDLVSMHDAEFALLLPSLIRFLSIAVTVNSIRTTLFASTPLQTIPFSLIRTAVTAPVSQEPFHYQRLETLGDTVLKYLTSIQLFAQYPLWHEGFLARRKDHTVSNARLAKEAVRLGLEKWIIRDRFVPRKWRPRYASDPVNVTGKKKKKDVESKEAEDVDGDGDGDDAAEIQESNRKSQQDSVQTQQSNGEAQKTDEKAPNTDKKKRKKKAKTLALSTKMMADVVEALIGAAYEQGGFDLSVECTRLFDLGLPHWDTVSNRVAAALSRVEMMEEVPAQLSLVEEMLGYEFVKKPLLVEALTHASYTGDIESMSYERLEFLGDAALDMVVTDYLYHAEGKNFSPGYMHIYKEALVNSHLLGFICVNTSVPRQALMPNWTPEEGIQMVDDTQQLHLYQCLLHSSPRILDDQRLTFGRYEKTGDRIKHALEKGKLYPWAALTSLQAPKFLSDMLESCLGAVFLDADGNLDVVRRVLEKLGIMRIMRRIVADEVDTLHPVSRLTIWAAKHERKWEIATEKADGNVTVVVKIDEEEVSRATQAFRGKTSVNEVRFGAAEEAIRKLEVVEQEEPADLDDAEWGDVPEYAW